ncbi:hypothetical protein [Nonomuraea indica]|uniref:hypothetical protein n=1 Tax=Nonomuraea indica TaxID=1581193 RepID=UPI000C7A01EE|nr:hypothetical protein [Nonomuraea indica]
MTHLRRTALTPLGQPTAGELVRGKSGPAVPISLGPGQDIVIEDPAWFRDLIAAASAGLSVLESELGLPAPERAVCGGDPVECVHEAARGQVEAERDAYREVLVQLASVERPSQLWPIIRAASVALEKWTGHA